MPRVPAGRLIRLIRMLTALSVGAALASCGGQSNTLYSAPNSVILADLNGDGALDISVASAVLATNGGVNPGYASVLLQKPAAPGTFATGVHYGIQGAPSGMAAGDLRGTGSIDLAVSNYSKATISVLLETGVHTAQYQAAINVPTTVAGQPTQGGQPNDVQIADINGDGHPDLVIAAVTLDGTEGNLVIVPQDPSNPGHFLTPVSYALPYLGYGVAVGDLNGDGLPDIAVTNFDVNGNNGTVSIFFQDPSNPGTFQPRVDVYGGGQPVGIKIADLNGDGLADIVVSNQGAGLGDTNLNDGPGCTVILQDPAAPAAFQSGVSYYTSNSVALAVGDLNGDGRPDIVLVSTSPPSGVIQVLLQDKSNPGVFLAPVAYSGISSPAGVAIGDLNGDGHPDIALADSTGAVVLFQNSTGDGTFGTASLVGT
jgi:hypothetical protein